MIGEGKLSVFVSSGIALGTLLIDSADSATPMLTLYTHKNMKVGGRLGRIERLVGMGMG